MIVEVDELKLTCDRLLEHLSTLGIERIELKEDLYWSIPRSQKFDLAKDPSDFTVGRLDDDWRELQAIMRNEKEPLAYALVWLGEMLQVIGEKVVR